MLNHIRMEALKATQQAIKTNPQAGLKSVEISGELLCAAQCCARLVVVVVVVEGPRCGGEGGWQALLKFPAREVAQRPRPLPRDTAVPQGEHISSHRPHFGWCVSVACFARSR